MSKRDIFNTRTQQVEEAELTVDANNEIVATFEDGGIVKFPAGVGKAELAQLIKQHQDANEGQEIITPEQEAEREAERNKALEVIGETTQEADTNHDPATEQPQE